MRIQTKETTISFKVNEETKNKVNELSAVYGVNQSKVLRTLIDIEHEKITRFKKMIDKDKKNS
ncbi:MAG: hypothetical protein KKE44_15795 [Proteobacteria bacterium]|nr:hypothetical protein [Pseudomonadota bacterium]MBU1584192.1 hypothetical protein [Pseudomonadota bacterium]MBU2452280.1 hypothetical protein [Pseudomonadota bacterium]MBU2628045.1 hypothetical protein [Pseudomonadota bacterium]